MKYIPRLVDSRLNHMLETFGAVLLRGPKWCGKTTTASHHVSSSLYLTNPANDFSDRRLAELEPSIAIEGSNPRLLDEWQEVPKLWDAVRYECDRRGGAGYFILTGSATPNDRNLPMHSGTGRIARLDMSTMSLAELGVSSGDVSLAGLMRGETYRSSGSLGLRDIAELIVRGGWPGAIDKSTEQASTMAADYINTVCESDISRIDGIRRDPEKVRLLVRSLARNESTLSGTKSLVRDIDGRLTRQTAATYESVLTRLNFICNIPAWDPALRSNVPLRVAPKRHIADPSLAAAAIGASADSLIEDVKTLGLLFESLVIHDLLAYASVTGLRVSHYHDRDNLEVDVVVSSANGDWLPIEVKLGAGGIDSGVKNLLQLEQRMTEAGNKRPKQKCVVVGFGAPAYVTPEGVQVIPIDALGA